MSEPKIELHRKEIRWFKCCTNGKSIGTRKEIPDHMFIILTNEAYNKKSDEICGVPLTSKKERYQDFILNCGLDITDDDVENFVFDRKTFVLFDRPTRLNKADLTTRQDNIGRVKEDYLDKVITKVSMFLRKGNASKSETSH